MEKFETSVQKAQKWALDFGETFDRSKTGLLWLPKGKNLSNNTILFCNQVIKPPTTIKWLDLTLECKLSFCYHVHNLITKAMESILQSRRLGNIIWDMPEPAMIQLIQLVLFPHVLHGILCWFITQTKTKVIKELKLIDYSALRFTLGAYWRTPINYLVSHQNIPCLIQISKSRCLNLIICKNTFQVESNWANVASCFISNMEKHTNPYFSSSTNSTELTVDLKDTKFLKA